MLKARLTLIVLAAALTGVSFGIISLLSKGGRP
jgi:hypothetical protein